MTETSRAQRFRWAYLYFTAIVVAYMAVILSAKLPPAFVDYPNWVYQGVLFHGVLAGHPSPGYAIKHYPVPNSTTTVGLGLLNMVFPWQLAAKLWVCFYLLLAGVATWCLCEATGRKSWLPILALPGVVFLNLDFWYGFSNFEIGVCLVMILLASLLRNASVAWITVLLVAIFFTHMEACASALLLLLVWCWQTKRFRLLLASVPTLGFTLWYAIGRFTSGNVDAGPARYVAPYGSLSFLLFKASTYFKVFGFVNASAVSGLSVSARVFGRGFFLFLILVAIVISLTGLILIARFLIKTGKGASDYSDLSSSSRDAVRISVGFLLFLSIVLPKLVLGTEDPGARLLLMAIALVMFFLPWRGRAGVVFATLSVFFCLVNLWQFAQISRDPYVPGSSTHLPQAVMKNSYLQPAISLHYYESLEKGTMNEPIFWTAMFGEEKK